MAVVAAGLLLVWMATVPANVFEAPVLPSVAVGLALGFVGRALGRWRSATHLATLAVVVFACRLAVADERCCFADWVAHPEVPYSLQLLASATVLGPTIVAVACLGLGPRAPAFALGVAAVGLVTRWGIPVGPAMVVLAFVCVRWVGARDEGTSSRLRIALVGLGALATLGVLGLVHDLKAIELARTAGVEDRRGIYLDSAPHLGLRVCAEALVIVGAAWMARAGTAGLLMLLVATPMLVPTVIGWGHLASWGWGCVVWLHPLHELRPCLVLGLWLAVVPWLGPLWRQRHVLFGSELERA